MAGDGVSLPTSIAQMGSVAKTQAKGQHAAHPTTTFADQLDKKDDLKVQRVKETQKAEQETVDPDQERDKDKRQRRRLRRNRKFLTEEAAAEEQEKQDENGEDQEEKVGVLIDLRV